MTIYTIYSGNRVTGEGISFSTSNLRELSNRANIGYWNLVRVFIRPKVKRWYWEHRVGNIDFIIIKSNIFFKKR